MVMHWFVEELAQLHDRVFLRGWACDPERPLDRIEARFEDGEAVVLDGGHPSPDVAAAHGPSAANCRFSGWAVAPPARGADELRLLLHFTDGGTTELDRLYAPAIDVDPYQDLERRFWALLDEQAEADVLEIGSRDRSGTLRRKRLGAGFSYTGLDIRPGPNVDSVGDAHHLRRHFGRKRFDAVMAMSVFEHLLMPWKVVLEINHVLRPGGLVWLASHQTFPLHEVPWDYWRFSSDAWQGLLNRATGFEIVEVAVGEPAAIVPRLTHRIVRGTDQGQAFLGSAVIARKIARTRLRWPVDTSEVVADDYPY